MPFRPLSLCDLLRGFGFYFLFQGLAPLLFEMSKHFWMIKGETLDKGTQGWLTLFMAFGGFCSIGLTCVYLTISQRKWIWNRASRGVMPEIFWGISVACIVASLLLFMNGIMNNVIHWMNPHVSPIEQPIVSHMREMIHAPLLFGLTMSTILVFVPISEEFLFRGLLLSWLIQKLPVWSAVLISSMLFAGFHFSYSVGWYNLSLLSSVFLLSLVLSTIYLRRGSLWASIGLHGTFNGINLILLVLT